ncbi:MAG: hypothetical protein GOU98_01425 [Candidatus Altiarchaeota archaeon]|nr:hypothetical protein [Candidatus Altiarchaeota archaeon]
MVNSLKTIIRFAKRPNQLGLCGIKDNRIYDLAKKDKWTNEEKEIVINFVKNLKVLYGYLSAIGKKLGKKFYDEEVVNSALYGRDDWHGFSENLKPELLKVAIEDKVNEINNLGDNLPLTHSFHVLYFGAVATDLPKTLPFADACKVSIGQIKGEVVEYNHLSKNLRIIPKKIKFTSPFFEVKDGDRVFLHHSIVFDTAEPEKERLYEENLKKTLKVVKEFW